MRLRQPVLPVVQSRSTFGREIERGQRSVGIRQCHGREELEHGVARLARGERADKCELDARIVVIGGVFPWLHGKTSARFDDEPDATGLTVGHTPLAAGLFQFEVPLLRLARESEDELHRPGLAGDHGLRVADHRLLAARECHASFARCRELFELEALACTRVARDDNRQAVGESLAAPLGVGPVHVEAELVRRREVRADGGAAIDTELIQRAQRAGRSDDVALLT